MSKKEVIKLDEKGIYETNDKRWVQLLGAELISVFTQLYVTRLYFRTKDGRIVRVKIGFDSWGGYIKMDELDGQ